MRGWEPRLSRAPSATGPATRKQMWRAAARPVAVPGPPRRSRLSALRRSAPPPHSGPCWRRPPGRSRGHMAEGDSGSDQRQVRPRRGADPQAGLGLASPPRPLPPRGPTPGAAPGPTCPLRPPAAPFAPPRPVFPALVLGRALSCQPLSFIRRVDLPWTMASSTISARRSSPGPETETRVLLPHLSPPGHLGQATLEARFQPLQNGQ